MLEPLISSILDQLAFISFDNARQKLKLVMDVEQEIKEIQSNFEAIQGKLEDAEVKQIVQKSIRLWFEMLKGVSYDMEDVLDKWNTAVLKLRTYEAEELHFWRKVISCLPCFTSCRQVVSYCDIVSEIKKINNDLAAIIKMKNMYDLTTSMEINQCRQPSTSFVNVSEIYGRDELKNSVVKKLLLGTGIETIAIVGNHGTGKTALAQCISKEPAVERHFSHVIWVYVSSVFDRNKIARAILSGLNQESKDLVSLQDQDVLTLIYDKIKNSRFLLVLDDVWTYHEENWEALKVVFRRGLPGSRVLLTVHEGSIARKIGFSQSQVFSLEELSDESCWLILRQAAFFGEDNDLCRDLEDVGRKIAEKCKGLPLLAKILGSLLREKKTLDEWQNVLDSELWKLKVAEKIFAPLLLSYRDLPSEMRSCLLHCAVFPKGFLFDADELIKHWMSHGFLLRDENLGMEEKGKECFNYLASRSFFQDFQKDGSGKISQCKMHPLMHDFLQYLTEIEVVEVKVDSGEILRLDLSSKKARHLRVMFAETEEFPVFTDGIEKLRSLVAIGQKCHVTDEAMEALFKAGKCLRLLDFHLCSWTCSKVKGIPNGIGELIHLRYLNLSCNELLEELPEAVCRLFNLQHLNLSQCPCLQKLPDGMGELINLKYLDTWGCPSLIYHPKGIGRLTALEELTFVRARIDGKNAREFSIGDMENLDLLRGSVKMTLVGNVADLKLEETERAKLGKKMHLNRLIVVLNMGEPSDEYEVVRQALNLPQSVDFSYEWLPANNVEDN